MFVRSFVVDPSARYRSTPDDGCIDYRLPVYEMKVCVLVLRCSIGLLWLYYIYYIYRGYGSSCRVQGFHLLEYARSRQVKVVDHISAGLLHSNSAFHRVSEHSLD